MKKCTISKRSVTSSDAFYIRCLISRTAHTTRAPRRADIGGSLMATPPAPPEFLQELITRLTPHRSAGMLGKSYHPASALNALPHTAQVAMSAGSFGSG